MGTTFAVAGLLSIVFVWIGSTIVYASRIKVAGPNEVFVISGRMLSQINPVTGEREIVNYRLLSGGRSFIWAVLERITGRLSLEIMTILVNAGDVRTLNGELVEVDSAAQAKIGSDDASIATALEHLLSKSQDEIAHAARETMLGHLRTILSAQTVEQTRHEWGVLAQRAQEAASADLPSMGLVVESFVIQDIRQT